MVKDVVVVLPRAQVDVTLAPPWDVQEATCVVDLVRAYAGSYLFLLCPHHWWHRHAWVGYGRHVMALIHDHLMLLLCL